MKRLNLKIKQKFVLLILFLMVLVTASIMSTTIWLSSDGKQTVLEGVAAKFEDIQKTSAREFANFTDLANEGIRLLPVETMEKDLNEKLKAPSFAASALNGDNVVETMKKAISLTVASLQEKLELKG